MPFQVRRGHRQVKVEIRVLESDTAHVLERVDPDVFDRAVIPELAAEFLADPRHHIAVAIDGDTVVGMASAVDYVHPDKPVQLWINEVGVADAYQRQGLGKRLLETLLAHGRTLGCEEAWVATDPDNRAACGLYASAGGDEEPFVMYTFTLGEPPDG